VVVIFRKILQTIRNSGFRGVVSKGLIYAGLKISRAPYPVGEALVSQDEILDLDWTTDRRVFSQKVTAKPLILAWIMSPPGSESGGHQNLFRFIHFLEDAGHTCHVYFYSSQNQNVDIVGITEMLKTSDAFEKVKSSFFILDRDGIKHDVDGIIATGWETAYPAFLDPSHVARFYFVQDYEPYFYPVGTQSLLAENTYRFGFHGITAGNWLASKLSTEFAMKCDSFQFAADQQTYHPIQGAPRDEVFFYARPVTTRRAFELGVLALKIFHEEMPHVTINLAGWKIDEKELPFPSVCHGSLQLSELNELYNRCRVGLVLSLTNMSLLPLELIASGVIPVVNDAPNNKLVSSNESIKYAAPNPRALSRAMVAAYSQNSTWESVQEITASLGQYTWENAGNAVTQAIARVIRND